MKKAFFLGIVFLVTASETSAGTPAILTKQQLQADFAILKRAYTELHPGLLEFSRFLGKIRCGHTYANFWNQSDDVQRQIFGQADKVPFTFRLIDRRMFVIENSACTIFSSRATGNSKRSTCTFRCCIRR